MQREVLVTWLDEPDKEFYAVVSVDEQWNELEDDPDVFFYFASEAEYQEALTNGAEEFTMKEVA